MSIEKVAMTAFHKEKRLRQGVGGQGRGQGLSEPCANSPAADSPAANLGIIAIWLLIFVGGVLALNSTYFPKSRFANS